jgi:hypothetical protein
MTLANDFSLRCYRSSYGSSNICDSKANWANFYHQTVSVYGSPSISYANKILDTNLALRAARYGHEKLVIRMLSNTKSTIKAVLISALALYAIQGGHTHFISSIFEYAFTRSPKLLVSCLPPTFHLLPFFLTPFLLFSVFSLTHFSSLQQGVDFHFLFLGAVRENQLRVAILLRCYSNIYVNDCEGIITILLLLLSSLFSLLSSHLFLLLQERCGGKVQTQVF